MDHNLLRKGQDEANELWLRARSPDADPAFLASMADHEVWFVRRAAAGNRATPMEVLDRLALDKDPSVRWAAAGNTSSSAGTLRRLANDEDWDVRYSAAGNTSTPGDELVRLARDPKILVRFAVVGNESVPESALGVLLKDDSTNLSKLAKQRLEELAAKGQKKRLLAS